MGKAKRTLKLNKKVVLLAVFMGVATVVAVCTIILLNFRKDFDIYMWRYRYAGITAATEIATGKYNNGNYDSLEHYLRATGRVSDLKNGKC